MKRLLAAVIILLALGGASLAQTPQEKEANRVATREKLRTLLATAGPKKGIEISFRQSDKQPFNFVAVKRGGFANAEGFEIVVGVSKS